MHVYVRNVLWKKKDHIQMIVSVNTWAVTIMWIVMWTIIARVKALIIPIENKELLILPVFFIRPSQPVRRF